MPDGPVKPLLIDYFCGEGGAAAGYVEQGLRVWGVDNNPKLKARYLASGAERFICADANTWEPDEEPAAKHYSPPCKDWTDLAAQSGGDGTGWMLPHAIERARRSGRPYVVENVDNARTRAVMDGAVMLCGSMFGLGIFTRDDNESPLDYRTLKRHRLFLTSFALFVPPDVCSGWHKIGVYGTGGGGQMNRGYKATLAQARAVMQMPWASRDGVSQAIPPAYTAFLGEHLMAELGVLAGGAR
jgi:DNA (cytosine-5)-methyltransferase 1